MISLSSQHPRRGAWLEPRTDDPVALRDKVLAVGLPEIKHPGHDVSFAAPGGQVLSVQPTSPQTRGGAGA